MNDTTELAHALQLVDKHITTSRESASEEFHSLLEESWFLRRANGEIARLAQDEFTAFYATCFCEKGDLLSQWRAYGEGGGGYAIGFSGYSLGMSKPYLLRKVIYQDEDKDGLVSSTIARAWELFQAAAKREVFTNAELKQIASKFGNRPESYIRASFGRVLQHHLSQFVFSYKDKGFQEEQEWRVVFPFKRPDHLRMVRFRDKRGLPVPYIVSNLGTGEGVVGDEKLPIVEFVCGPSSDAELTRKSLHLLLEQIGYSHVEVRRSEVPYRT
jgi:hypothetical protein